MSLQIKGKFIRSDAIDSNKILLKAGQALRVLAQDGSEKRLIELSAAGKVLVNGEEVALKSQLDAQYSALSASIAAETAARAASEAAISQEIAEITSDLAAETSARQQAQSELEASIEAEALARSAEIASESARAQAAEAVLQSQIDSESTTRSTAIAAETSARQAAVSSLETQLSAETARATAEEAALSTAITTVAGSVSNALSTANSYTDQKISELVNAAPETLNTLKELSDALNGDASFAQTVISQIAFSAQSAVTEAVAEAEAAIDSFGERLAVEPFTVNSIMISSNFIDLQHKAFSASLVVSIDRLLLLEDEDFTVSVVDGKTRLTFIGSMVQGQEEALEVGDKVRVRYLKDIRN